MIGKLEVTFGLSLGNCALSRKNNSVVLVVATAAFITNSSESVQQHLTSVNPHVLRSMPQPAEALGWHRAGRGEPEKSGAVAVEGADCEK